MPPISNIRTPMRLLEIPRRTFWRESLFFLKKARRCGERVGVAQLAADDDAALEVLACDLRHLRAAVVHDLGGSDLGRTDLQADELLLAAHGCATLAFGDLSALRRCSPAAAALGLRPKSGLRSFGFSAFGSSAAVSFFFRPGAGPRA